MAQKPEWEKTVHCPIHWPRQYSIAKKFLAFNWRERKTFFFLFINWMRDTEAEHFMIVSLMWKPTHFFLPSRSPPFLKSEWVNSSSGLTNALNQHQIHKTLGHNTGWIAAWKCFQKPKCQVWRNERMAKWKHDNDAWVKRKHHQSGLRENSEKCVQEVETTNQRRPSVLKRREQVTEMERKR